MAIFSNKKTEDARALAAAGDHPAPKQQTTKLVKAEASVQKEAPMLGASVGIIVQPRLSEKTIKLSEKGQYVFKVRMTANKLEIRKAVEKMYGVKVVSINVVLVKGKKRRFGRTLGATAGFKKAIITLTPDSPKPEIFQVG